jgi:hypothetical protein
MSVVCDYNHLDTKTECEKVIVAISLNLVHSIVYDNEITSLIDIYFLRISFIPSEPF